MAKGKETNPKNLFKRGDSWILDFYFRGRRYTETLGTMSRSVAQEKRDEQRGKISAGELAVAGKLWKNKQWVAVVEETPIEDPDFETAVKRYLDWYKGHSRPSSYERQLTCAVALKATFAGKRLSEISAFGIEAYKSDRKTACSCLGVPKQEKRTTRSLL